MIVVAALGGNALLRRGERPDAGTQRDNVRIAAGVLAELAEEATLVVTHGDGPQIGLLADESAADPSLSRPYPLDVLGAEADGMIGYLLALELGNALGPERSVVALLTQTVVDADDPALRCPTKPVGQLVDERTAFRLSRDRGWAVARDGERWRHVVGSPQPTRIVEVDAVRTLVAAGNVVICCGGGGVPVTEDAQGHRSGVEAVVDKDLVSALLATQLGADALLFLTDVPGVCRDWGTPQATVIGRAVPAELRASTFATGSMGPKVDAACRFVEAGGRRAAIGHLERAVALLHGRVGTQVTREAVAP